MQTDFSDLLTLAIAADAFAWPPLQREAEMATIQRDAPYDAPLEPSVVPTPLRTGAVAPGSSLNAPAPPPAQREAYRSPLRETAAAPHLTLLENAARVIESLTASAALEPRCAWSGDTPSRAPRRYDSANYAEDRGRDTYAISDRALDLYSYGRRTSRPTPQFRTTDSRPNEAARQEETRLPQGQRADVVELGPGSAIFIESSQLKSIETYSKTATATARGLLAAVFTQQALVICSVKGQRAKGSHRPSEQRPPLDVAAVTAILSHTKAMCKCRGWDYNEKVILLSLGTKLSEMRSGVKQLV
ncbi:hypothetical protein HPB47_016559 [Ixodes persulcatus]|uniref:Uncharacterized protein n=1 Tax=Ixodes persulcatus TaxID=34615 RepID=A0AC60QT33_IXOPE|nr:hypothetical protein HPB47_016559 [Ixodes persulcatus]